MLSLLNKEIQHFFSSPIGYLVSLAYVVSVALFFWFFEQNYNILDYGYADMTFFFMISSWVFCFIVPAITMASFSEEYRSGTFSVLQTLPVSTWSILVSKFLASLFVSIINIVATLVFAVSIYLLAQPVGNMDIGATLGSYVGLVMLCGVFTAVGIYSSSVTTNQIVAFFVGVFICFVLFYGIEGLSPFLGVDLEQYSLNIRFESLGRGVVDTRDVVYLLSLTILFLSLAYFRVKARSR